MYFNSTTCYRNYIGGDWDVQNNEIKVAYEYGTYQININYKIALLDEKI
jgi:hypothetical protein